jgi:hypothetical protein
MNINCRYLRTGLKDEIIGGWKLSEELHKLYISSESL